MRRVSKTSIRVGFIGLGDQGAPMAQAIADHEFELHVWARRQATLEVLAGFSHHVSDSANQLAGNVDVLLLCLPDDSDVERLLADGLRGALRPGSVLVNTGTGDPAWSSLTAEQLGLSGISYLDAPVSGGGAGARARTLTTMVGGHIEAHERCVPILQTFSQSVERMGPAGSGQTAKLLNNALTMTNLDNAADILEIAHRLDVDIVRFLRVMTHSSGGSFILDALSTKVTRETAAHLQTLMHKDIDHFADALTASGIDASVLSDRGQAGADKLIATVNLVADSAASGRREPS